MRALIFDLDGTLFDSVYAHVLSWQKSFAAEGLQAPACSIHKKFGMGGQELTQVIGRELGKSVSEDEAQAVFGANAWTFYGLNKPTEVVTE